jgi:hypothetical protein
MIKPLIWKPLNFYYLNLFFGGAIFLPLNKTYISYWLNLYKLEFLKFFLAKPIPLGKTSIFSWLDFYLLAKPLPFDKKIVYF